MESDRLCGHSPVFHATLRNSPDLEKHPRLITRSVMILGSYFVFWGAYLAVGRELRFLVFNHSEKWLRGLDFDN
jgi:hypothetical protein